MYIFYNYLLEKEYFPFLLPMKIQIDGFDKDYKFTNNKTLKSNIGATKDLQSPLNLSEIIETFPTTHLIIILDKIMMKAQFLFSAYLRTVE